MFSRRGLASRHERGSAGIFGSERASSGAMCFAPGMEAQPGVGRIAGNDVIVSDCAALDVTFGAPGAIGEKLFLSCGHLPRDRNK